MIFFVFRACKSVQFCSVDGDFCFVLQKKKGSKSGKKKKKDKDLTADR